MSPNILGLALVSVLTGCVSTQKQTMAQSNAELGAAYLREGDGAGALKVLQDAVHQDPRNWEAWNRLGLAYWAQRDLDQSEDAFDHAVNLMPDNAEVRNNYGLMLMAKGRNEEAINSFEIARKDLLYRKPAIVLSNLGQALYQVGRYDEALDVLDQALQRTPNLCQALFNRALVYQKIDRLDGALDSFEATIRSCGSTAVGSYYHAGTLLIARGDRDSGCAYLVTAIEQSRAGGDLYEAATKAKAVDCP